MIHAHKDTPTSATVVPPDLAPIVSVLVLVGIITSLVAPRATPVVLHLIALSILALAATGGQSLALRSWPPVVPALCVFGGYLALNAFWAVNPLHGLLRALLFALIVALGAAVWAALPKLSSDAAERLHRALLVGICLATAYLCIETLAGQPIRRFVISLIPALQPSPKHMTTADGWVTHLNLYTLNRNFGLLNLLLWPALLLMRNRMPVQTARIYAFGLLAAAAAGVFASEHESSMLALVAGCLVFVGMTLAASVVRKLVLAMWIAATLLVVPIADLAHDTSLHHADWLPQTARNRIVLWSVTADRLQDSPIFGVGIDSTKPLDQKAAPTATHNPGDEYAQRTGRHAHNIFMQTWYELGAVGACLLLLAGLAALRSLSRLPASQQSLAYAGFVSALVIASFTWGMWQPWFMCAFGLWALLWLIALDAARRGNIRS